MSTDEERAELNALVREAHEAIKDLNRATKAVDDKIAEARVWMNEIAALVHEHTSEMLREAANVQIARLAKNVDREIAESKQVIAERFEAITLGLPMIEETIARMERLQGIQEVNEVINSKVDQFEKGKNRG